MSFFCEECEKDAGYILYQYVEKEIIPCADGGIINRRVLTFCSVGCLFVWLAKKLEYNISPKPKTECPF